MRKPNEVVVGDLEHALGVPAVAVVAKPIRFADQSAPPINVGATVVFADERECEVGHGTNPDTAASPPTVAR